MPITSVQISWRRPDATLLQADGSEYPHGGTIIKLFNPAHDKRFGAVITYEDNYRGFSTRGDPQGHIDSFVVECFHDNTVKQIKADIMRENTLGLFIIELPGLTLNDPTDRYVVRFFDAPFTPQSPRRARTPRIHQASITDIDVYGHEQI